eukprot:11182721-Lingulodinium_polyedra.AAC.1
MGQGHAWTAAAERNKRPWPQRPGQPTTPHEVKRPATAGGQALLPTGPPQIRPHVSRAAGACACAL